MGWQPLSVHYHWHCVIVLNFSGDIDGHGDGDIMCKDTFKGHLHILSTSLFFVSGTFDLFNVMCKQRHRAALLTVPVKEV